jgi:hypothetical protein
MKTLTQLEAFQRDLWHRLRARSATARHGATEPMRTIGQVRYTFHHELLLNLCTEFRYASGY